MPLITDIADAVVTEVNTPGSVSPLEGVAVAVRQYRPRKELKDLKVLAVTVVPKAVEVGGATRGTQQFDCEIDVAVQQKLADDSDTAIDPLVQKVEQLIDYLSRRRLAALPEVVPVKVQNNPIYAVEHLDELRVFTSVITITYRALR